MFGTLKWPVMSGSNMIFAAGMPVMDSAPCVVPWYATALLMTLWREGWPVSLKYLGNVLQRTLMKKGH